MYFFLTATVVTRLVRLKSAVWYPFELDVREHAINKGCENFWSDTNLEIEVIDLLQQFVIKLDISESRHLRNRGVADHF